MTRKRKAASPGYSRFKDLVDDHPSNEVTGMKLVLVYNADNGLFNALTDTAHKIFSPHTYQCSLCRYTYGTMGMVRPWKLFLDSLDCPKEFLHRNEFLAQYPHGKISLPAILWVDENGLKTLLSAEEIKECGNLEKLTAALRTKLTGLCPAKI